MLYLSRVIQKEVKSGCSLTLIWPIQHSAVIKVRIIGANKHYLLALGTLACETIV